MLEIRSEKVVLLCLDQTTNGGTMERIQEHDGNTLVEMYVDRFDQVTVVRSTPIKGMGRSCTVQHGPGKGTRSLRNSAGKVQRGRTFVDDLPAVK